MEFEELMVKYNGNRKDPWTFIRKYGTFPKPKWQVILSDTTGAIVRDEAVNACFAMLAYSNLEPVLSEEL